MDFFLLKAISYKLKVSSGFTLIEVLSVLAILSIVAALSLSSLSGFNSEEALKLQTERAVSLLTKARTLTISAKSGLAYGVHFETQRIVLFRGGTYSASDASNQVEALPVSVQIGAVTLSGGGSDVIFKKLTGATAQSGTIRLVSSGNANASTTVTILPTGIVYSN